MNWFECKVSYEKIAESGVTKRIAQTYLVDALSHAEAEARIIKEVEPYISGEFTVSSVRRVNYTEIFTSETSDCWWKLKIYFITLDEKTGVEKRVNTSVLVNGDEIEDAIITLREGMIGSMDDYGIAEAKMSNILEVFVYAKD
jgi:hypothetical protein